MIVSVFDTTVSNNNLGNWIIMDEVYKHLYDIFPSDFFLKHPFIDSIGSNTIQYLKQSDFVFFGGTNSLSSEMEHYKQWGLDLENSQHINDVILMGLGWWQYQDGISDYTQTILHRVLNKNYFHSVRDSYTAEKLKSIGITNVLNTGCPTLWDIDQNICQAIPQEKAENVLLTFTNYYQNIKSDTELYNTVKKNYKTIYLWIQGPEDYQYAKDISSEIKFIDPNLNALDDLLSSSIDLDYVGTRLHAGIRALKHKRRSIIIGVDNRSVEMGKDFELKVIKRAEQHLLDKAINSNFKTELKLPYEAINTWKQQFIAAKQRM